MEQESENGIIRVMCRIETQLVGIKKRLDNIEHGMVPKHVLGENAATHLLEFQSLVKEHRELIECQRTLLQRQSDKDRERVSLDP